jgi:hypothetical protein
VSVVPSWTVVDETQALADVLNPAFDPADNAVVEAAPGISPSPPSTGAVPDVFPSASYTESDPEHIRVNVTAPGASIVVVRNSYDPGWSATVDGVSAPVIPTDYLMQGVPVQAGEHVITLTYRDTAIVAGLEASAGAWGALVLAWVSALVLERRRRSRAPIPPAATPTPGGGAPPR